MMLSYLRTIILYLALIAAMRILGKRQIGQLEPSEFVVAMLIADLASVPMQNSGIPLLYGLVPIATVLGLVAKEEVVGVFGSLSSMASADVAFELVDAADSAGLTFIGREFFNGSALSGFSFLTFNLLCAPCFAAMGAIKREMNNGKWTAFAIGYMCAFAYAISLMIYQFGLLFQGQPQWIGLIAASVVLVALLWLLLRRNPANAKKHA